MTMVTMSGFFIIRKRLFVFNETEKIGTRKNPMDQSKERYDRVKFIDINVLK